LLESRNEPKGTDRNNNVTWYHYDSSGLIEQVVVEREGDDEITTYEPSDAQGLINDIPEGRGTPDNPADPVYEHDSTYTDPNGNTYTIVTDKYGRELKRTDPLGNVTEYERGCDCGAPTKITKPNGAEITMEYDDIGNLLSRTEQIDEQTSTTYTYEYHPTFNKITKIIDPENNETDFTYDAINGNLLKITDALDNETVFEYNDKGLVTLITDALDYSSTITYYEPEGNIHTISDPLGNTTTYDEYDLAGNIKRVIDAEEKVTNYTYDLMNLIKTVTDDDQEVTTHDYDSEGNLTSIIDAETHETTFTYELNRLKSTEDPLGYIWNYFYDLNGNLERVEDPEGNEITYEYDEINRLETKKLYDDSHVLQDQVDYTYNSVSNLLSVTKIDSSLTMTYYLNGWLKTADNGIGEISYEYYKNGNRKKMTDIEDGVTTYYYTALNLLDYMTNPSGKVTDYSYDDFGRRTSVQHHNGTVAELDYDDAGRLLSLVNKLNETAFASYVYTHDGVGNRDTMTDLDGLHDYTYDDLYRLTIADHPQPQYPDNDENFSYDAVGNRLTSAGYPTWTYDNNNRLTSYNGPSYAYDNNGNMISKTVGSEITTYEYDIENRLVRIEYPDETYSEYKYDPFGRRIEKNVDGTVTKYMYDGEDILYGLDGSNQIISRFTHGPRIDEPIIVERNVDVYYYHTDGLGSITKLTDASGSVIQSYLYDSFGNIVTQSGSVNQLYTYTGREYDSESGLYYYRARYYDSEIGRFLTTDLSHRLQPKGSDIPYLLPFVLNSPQELNQYLYVLNNPINYIDPKGLSFTTTATTVPPECKKEEKCKTSWTECVRKCIDFLDLPPAADPTGLYDILQIGIIVGCMTQCAIDPC